MTDLESRSLAEMADIKPKSTNLSLIWAAEDTAAAKESAKILVQRLRNTEKGPEKAGRMENSEYLKWIAFETSYRLCLEQRPLQPPVAEVQQNCSHRFVEVMVSHRFSNLL